MTKYILKRIIYSVFILLCVSFILYAIMRCVPISYVEQKVYSQANIGLTPEQIQAEINRLNAVYGTDKNIFAGYFGWLGDVFHADLGVSFTRGQDVTKVIGKYMWVSFTVAMIAFVLQYVIAIPLGVKAAVNQYGKLDYFVTIFTVVGISLPSFFLGTILIKVFAVNLGWFPQQGSISATIGEYANVWEKMLDTVYHYILPVITIVLISLGGLMRHTRTNTLEVLNADYIRTARAKGLSEHSVVYKHAFRNTLIPLVTMMAGVLPSLFGGMLILEEVFAIEGLGQIAYKALATADIPLVMGYCMFLAILTVLGTLLSDLAYMLVDPRVKISK